MELGTASRCPVSAQGTQRCHRRHTETGNGDVSCKCSWAEKKELLGGQVTRVFSQRAGSSPPFWFGGQHCCLPVTRVSTQLLILESETKIQIIQPAELIWCVILEVYSSRVSIGSFSRSLPSPCVPHWSCRAGQLHVMNHLLFLFPRDMFSHQPGLLGWDLLQSQLEEPLTEVEPC